MPAASAAVTPGCESSITRRRARGPGLCSFAGGRVCPASHTDCPMRLAA